LNVPASVYEFGAHVPELLVFLAGFALIALVWWYHNRLFAHYFVATPGAIVLNFTLLAGIIVLVYAVEIVAANLQVAFDPRRYLAGFALWLAAYGVVMMIMGAMYALGLRARARELTDPVRRWGAGRAANAGFGGIALLLMGAALPWLPFKLVWLVAVFAFVPLLAERMVLRNRT